MKKLTILFLLLSGVSFAQNKSMYFSWGYNKEWYTPSDINVKQDAMGNDYKFNQVKAHDKPGWNTGIFNKDLTIPQYNYRLGYFYNDNSAFELNFDHTKYQVQDPQVLKITGKINGQQVDSSVYNNKNGVLNYQLNNGANFFLFNWVKRFPIYNYKDKIVVSFLSKQGVGFVYPHVENTILQNKNNAHFQFGGFDIGYEAGARVTFFKYAYLEYTNKLDYAWYSNLKIYKGTVKQHFGTFELVLSAGVTWPIGAKKAVKNETIAE